MIQEPHHILGIFDGGGDGLLPAQLHLHIEELPMLLAMDEMLDEVEYRLQAFLQVERSTTDNSSFGGLL